MDDEPPHMPPFILFEGKKDGQHGHIAPDGVVKGALLHGAGLLIVDPHRLLRIKVDDLARFQKAVHFAVEIAHGGKVIAQGQHAAAADERAPEPLLVVFRAHRVEGAEIPHRLPHEEGIKIRDVVGNAHRAAFFEGFQIFFAHHLAAVGDFEDEGREHRHPEAQQTGADAAVLARVVKVLIGVFPIAAEGDIIEIEAAVALERPLDALPLFKLAAFCLHTLPQRAGNARVFFHYIPCGAQSQSDGEICHKNI